MHSHASAHVHAHTHTCMCTHTCMYTHEHTHLHGHIHEHTHTRTRTLPSRAAPNAAHLALPPVLCRSFSNLSTAWFSRKTLGPKSAGRPLASPPLPPPVSVSALRGGHTQGACQQRTWTSHSPAGWMSEITLWGDTGGSPPPGSQTHSPWWRKGLGSCAWSP